VNADEFLFHALKGVAILSALFAARRMTMALHCHAEPCFPEAKPACRVVTRSRHPFISFLKSFHVFSDDLTRRRA